MKSVKHPAPCLEHKEPEELKLNKQYCVAKYENQTRFFFSYML